MASTKLTIERGTTYGITGTYLRNGVATSLIGATIRFTMKPVEYDADTADSSASILKNLTNGTAQGTYSIIITPSDTALLIPNKYYYDIKVQNADSTIYQLVEGQVVLSGNPTNRLT